MMTQGTLAIGKRAMIWLVLFALAILHPLHASAHYPAVMAKAEMERHAVLGGDHDHHHGHSHDDGDEVERMPGHAHNHGSVDHSHDLGPLARFDYRPGTMLFTRLKASLTPIPDPGPAFRLERPPRL
jgi:hypothetical protein